MAAKQTKRVIHSSKRKGSMLYMAPDISGLLELAWLQGVLGPPWHGKTRKTIKTIECIGEKKSEKLSSLLTKTENQRLIEENWQTKQDTKTKNLQFLSAKTEEHNPKIGQICKTKNPNAPLAKQSTVWNWWKYTVNYLYILTILLF